MPSVLLLPQCSLYASLMAISSSLATLYKYNNIFFSRSIHITPSLIVARE